MPPEGMGPVDVTTVAVVVVSSESLVALVAEVDEASTLVEAVEVIASVVKVVTVVVAAVLVPTTGVEVVTVEEVINVTLGQHSTLYNGPHSVHASDSASISIAVSMFCLQVCPLLYG